MAATTRYTVTRPMRWDEIAYEAYGDATKMKVVLRANPLVPKTKIIPPGVVLNLPIMTREEVQTSNRPPWKR